MSNAAYYWTAFCFDGHEPTELHCTHKFLGDLPAATAAAVHAALDDWFHERPMRPLTLEFDQPALFGQDADVAVLLATENTKTELSYFGALRASLDLYRADDFPEYKPHVTTDSPHFVGQVTGYVLMRGHAAIKYWYARDRYSNAGYTRIAPVKEHPSDYDQLEKEILRAFRKELYGPILKILGFGNDARRLANAGGARGLKSAIASGAVTYRLGAFAGRFTSAVSKELRSLGAVWDKKRKAWAITTSQLPEEIRKAITASNEKWRDTLDRIDDQIRQVLPAEVAGKVDSFPLFDSSLWKVDRKVDNTLKSISVLPKLTDERRRKIAAEWRDNLDLWIKDFAAEEIPKLRDAVAAHAMGGGRHEDLVKTLQKSYGVTQRKAQFLARQETNLLMAKFKEARYAEAGVYEYEWGCVAGSAAHPVRPAHLALKGKVFRFDNPPVTTAPSEPARRNNPGEDYNCRCFARPIVRGDRRAKAS